MSDPAAHLDDVHDVIAALADGGFEPILVGGMALVALGSQRVTRDFDFVVAAPGSRLQSLVEAFYDRGWELVSRLNDAGGVIATIDNPRVAGVRIRVDGPVSVFFFNHRTRLRIDLLFDFPIPAATLAAGATRVKVHSREFTIASEDDLLKLKRIAKKKRSNPGDAQDIAFLEATPPTAKVMAAGRRRPHLLRARLSSGRDIAEGREPLTRGIVRRRRHVAHAGGVDPLVIEVEQRAHGNGIVQSFVSPARRLDLVQIPQLQPARLAAVHLVDEREERPLARVDRRGPIVRQYRIHQFTASEQRRRDRGVRADSKRALVALGRERGDQLADARRERRRAAHDALREARQETGPVGFEREADA